MSFSTMVSFLEPGELGESGTSGCHVSKLKTIINYYNTAYHDGTLVVSVIIII